MIPRWPTSEADLAALVVAWLERECWDVYHEVSIGQTADIVARRGPVLWVIETKRSMSLSVIGQAQRWAAYAHLRSVAVPVSRGGAGRDMAHEVCRRWGIGVIEARENGNVMELVAARFARPRYGEGLSSTLRPEHKTHAVAGTTSGGRWSDWRGTCRELQREVESDPGVTLRDALKRIRYHYASASSARAALSHQLQAGEVSGVRCIVDGRELRLYPREASATTPEFRDALLSIARSARGAQ